MVAVMYVSLMGLDDVAWSGNEGVPLIYGKSSCHKCFGSIY